MAKVYTDHEKEMAVAAWIETQTYKGAARATGIPRTTISGWHQAAPTWWEETVARLLEINKAEREAKLVKIMNKSSDEILERFEKGDEKINNRGERYRVKVSARDLAVILGIASEKYSLSLGLPTKISGQAKTDSTADRLGELREAAAKSAKGDTVVDFPKR